MINKYKNEDIDQIINLGSNIVSNFESLFHIKKLNENEEILVYKEADKIVGFIHHGITDDVADILNIYVEKTHRNQGIAMQLIDNMFSSIPQEVNKIMLEVSEQNIPAISLYSKFNFEVINIRPNYYGKDSGLVMERNIE